MSAFIGYTIGLMFSVESLKKPVLAKAEFNHAKCGGVKITLASGRNLSTIRAAGEAIVSKEEYEKRPQNDYDYTVEAQWAFNKLGVSA